MKKLIYITIFGIIIVALLLLKKPATEPVVEQVIPIDEPQLGGRTTELPAGGEELMITS